MTRKDIPISMLRIRAARSMTLKPKAITGNSLRFAIMRIRHRARRIRIMMRFATLEVSGTKTHSRTKRGPCPRLGVGDSEA